MMRRAPAVPLLIAAAILVFHLSILPRTTLFDRDEPRFAQAAVEMAESSNWLYPTVAGEVRAQKPILIYWLMGASVRLFGAGSFAVRLPSAIALTVTALATWWIGRRLLGARAATVAMVMVALNPMALVEGTAATADATLLALTTIAMAAVVARLTAPAALAPALAFAGATAGALLAKGPAGLLAAAAAAVIFWRLRASPDARRGAFEFGAAALAALAVFAWWFTAADRATGGAFMRVGVRQEILQRIVTPLEGHGASLAAWMALYPATILIGFAPWSPLLVAAWRSTWTARRDERPVHLILAAWILVPAALFAVVATRLPHYLLPIWPALALMCGRFAAGHGGERERPLVASTLTGAALALLAAAAIGASPWLLGVPRLLAPSVVMAAALATCAAIALRDPQNLRTVLRTSVAGALAFEAVAGWWWLPIADGLKPVPCLATAVRPLLERGAAIAAFDVAHPSVVYYLKTRPRQIASLDEARRWMDQTRGGVLLVTRDGATALADRRWHERAACRGFDISRGSRLELVALAGTPGPGH